ncbi:MAG: fluoride efflux transporter CrcB [Burkholderiales bacterium]|nr:fluoride efflux transporter CrcB [Burkholderiales bacterium]
MNYVAISIGAALGAIFRWQLTLRLAAVLQQFPFGTIAANLIGAYLAGIASAFFASHPNLPPQWRLLAVTGFLGGLTTFSTFSAESMSLLQKGDYGLALAHSAVHLLGSIALCIAGFATYRALAS